VRPELVEGLEVRFSRPLLALILGQIALHSCMAGVRMAAPLQALAQHNGPGAVGVLMALFAAAPIVLALPAGRMADRHGYHRPLYIAVALSIGGGIIAALTTGSVALKRCLSLFSPSLTRDFSTGTVDY